MEVDHRRRDFHGRHVLKSVGLSAQVPREDIAKLIFDVVENGTASNLTIEVNNEDCVTKYGQELSKFSKDDMDARSFAPFPFVPQ